MQHHDYCIKIEVEKPGLSIITSLLTDYDQTPSTAEFAKFEAKTFQKIRQRMSLSDMKDDKRLRAYRNLYWTFGMDPTKLRVSSEALIRRVLHGENLWRISSLVDTINLASAYHAIPIGLIDVAKLEGYLRIRVAKRGEVFHRIGGKTLTCRGREIVLADDKKIVCFGFATHDSEFTKVTEETKCVLLVLYGAPGISREEMHSAMGLTCEMIKKWVKCEIGVSHFIGI